LLIKRITFLTIASLSFSVLVSFNTLAKRPKSDLSGPGELRNVLFYIQRSINISTIIYELNVNEEGELNAAEPVKIYWKNYATDNSTEPLNYIQKKYAYGIDIKIIDVKKNTVSFNFVSYQKKTIYLIKSPIDGRYKAYCNIAGKFVVLNKIFIQLNGGTFWFPKIKFIEVSGKDTASNEDVSEKIIP